RASSCRPISPSFCCRRSAQSSTRSRTSGSSCATTGSPTASSNPTTISSTIVARHGTSSSISLGASCPSDCANGPTGSDQWDLVLITDRPIEAWYHRSIAMNDPQPEGHMASDIRRRKFLATLGGAAAAWPFAARAQQSAQVSRIGVLRLGPASAFAGRLEALRAGFRQLGYVEGKDIVFELRWAET